MEKAPGSSPSLDSAMLLRLEEVIAMLANGLSMLDALDMFNEASHVSLGYELCRQRLDKLRNEVSSAA